MDNLRRVVAVPTQPEDSDYESFVVSSGTLVSLNIKKYLLSKAGAGQQNNKSSDNKTNEHVYYDYYCYYLYCYLC